MSMRCDATMVWWIREVFWMAANPGGSIRLGDTVRRNAGPWTPAVHSLLGHLHDTGIYRALTAFAWVPLHTRHVVEDEGFAAFADRPRRLRLFLDSYGCDGQAAECVSTVQARVAASAEGHPANCCRW